MSRRRIHDGIMEALLTPGILQRVYVNALWLWLPGIIGVDLLQSIFTSFCPVFFTLDKVMKTA